MKTKVVHAGGETAVEKAAAVLQAGGLVVLPTDTVYGLAAMPTNRDAVQRIFEVKGRNTNNPIALLLSDVEYLEQVAILPDSISPLVEEFWPGGITLILQKTEAVLPEVSAGPTVGVRIPGLSLARNLIRAAGGTLAVTSANRSGEPAPFLASEVLEQLSGEIELVIDGGRCPGGVPSTVLDATVWPPAILRHGAVSETAIQKVLAECRALD
jgi:L-threonylcarbamoyladenylate synthase